MAKIQIKTKKTAKDVLVEYQVRYQFSDADLMELFGVSRQMVWNYLTGRMAPSITRLLWLASSKAGEWEGEMCREMLLARGYEFKAVAA